MFPFFHRLILVVFILLISASNSGRAITGKTPSQVLADFLQVPDPAWVDEQMNRMSLDEKIAQLFMVAAYSNKGDSHTKEIRYMVEKLKVGGLIFFQGNPGKQIELTNYYQSLASVPLIIAMDAEWGPSMRLDSTIKWPFQMQLGAIDDDELIYDMGVAIAHELNRLGVHINFAPVVDINSNPQNPVINHRSFGEDVVNITRKSMAYMRGMQDNGVLAFAKHFPGHGDTETDSHYALPVVNRTRSEVLATEGIPYQYLMKNGLAGIMTGHLLIPALDSIYPASLSREIISGMLQESLGFEGLCITDALNMAGAQRKAKPGEIEMDALMAGNDIILMSTQVTESIKAIRKAVDKGRISQERINHSCRKILRSKYLLGLAKNPILDQNNWYNDMHPKSHLVLLRKLQESSLTLVKNETIIPYQNLEKFAPGLIYFGKESEDFVHGLNRYQSIERVESRSILNSSNTEILDLFEDYNHIIIGLEAESQLASKNFGISLDHIEACIQLAALKPTTLVLFGNPYALSLFPNLDDFKAVLITYQSNTSMRNIAAQALYGGIAIRGRLPVSVAKHHIRCGDGERIFKPIRLSYGFPEMQGMSSDTLNKIAELINKAILDKATPGAQVLIARNGMVVYHEVFGKHTYRSQKKVLPDDVYDLASITKIAATVPMLMHLEEENLFNPIHPIADYLPGLDTTNKANITSMEILAHQSGLQAWIPFYKNILKDEVWTKEVLSKKQDSLFSIPIAGNLFVRSDYTDSIYQHIYASELREKKDYRYSDLGFYLFQRLIENQMGNNLKDLCDSLFYKPLGCNSLSFKPLDYLPLDRIIPTEDDKEFRKELIHGRVHDPGAVLMGGVAGHAGLFANINDLAKLMQLFLWKGNYGGEHFFMEKTIEKYTKAHFLSENNRRGLGFDKPEYSPEKDSPISRLASPRSFGHSGFTGTIAWVDPDKQLVYILLANRIHPDSGNNIFGKMNVRPRVSEIIYQSIQ